MSSDDAIEEAIELLQQLGLKEYEARCFVGLSQLSTGTAKELGEITEVPRTRVYDAIRVLEAQGLVEIQHSSPQQFRAVPLDEATETLRDQYEARVERLANSLEQVETVTPDDQQPAPEVWALSGPTAVTNRVEKLLRRATEEVVLVVGDEAVLTPDLVDCLTGLDSVDLLLGAVTDSLEEQLHDAVPTATTFVSGLDWLRGGSADDSVVIARLMLVDRSTILVSTLDPETGEEHAVFSSGFKNGLVVIARRLMAQGLVPERDDG